MKVGYAPDYFDQYSKYRNYVHRTVSIEYLYMWVYISTYMKGITLKFYRVPTVI